MANHNLSKEQVRDLVYSYDSAEVTNQLYKFGETALGEIDGRLARINSRAIAVLGWSTAILAFFLVGINRASGAGIYFLLVSSIFAIVAVLCSFNALRTRGDWKSPSDESWIHKSALVREDELKRYHVRVLHDVKRWRLAITNAKLSSLFAGEVFLILASLTLFAGIAYHLLLAKIPGLFAFAKII